MCRCVTLEALGADAAHYCLEIAEVGFAGARGSNPLVGARGGTVRVRGAHRHGCWISFHPLSESTSPGPTPPRMLDIVSALPESQSTHKQQ